MSFSLLTYLLKRGSHRVVDLSYLPLLNLIKTNYQVKYWLLELNVFLHKLNINLFNIYFCSVAVTYWGLPKLHSISNQDDKKMSDRTRDIYCLWRLMAHTFALGCLLKYYAETLSFLLIRIILGWQNFISTNSALPAYV